MIVGLSNDQTGLYGTGCLGCSSESLFFTGAFPLLRKPKLLTGKKILISRLSINEKFRPCSLTKQYQELFSTYS
jgi:hypothetical protein